MSVSTGDSNTSDFRYPIEKMTGIHVRWPRRPWNRASPSNPAIRKYSIEMVADINTEVRRCTVMLYPHPLTNSQGYASLQCAQPQPSQCCISWSLDWKRRPYSMACEVTWPESPSLFLCEYLNSLVFETPVETDKELVARIVAVYDIIHNTSGIFVRVRQNPARRCHFCIEVNSRRFEQLL